MRRAIIQARMSSTRFPGKVLAMLCGKPVLSHVVDRLARVLPREAIIVATSSRTSDDPIATHARSLEVALFRGPLEDVSERFRLCLREYPCDEFFRICADSPLLDETLLPRIESHAGPGVDLVTNIFPRTFPKGHSVELVRTETFLRLDPEVLTRPEREHVTQVYYNHSDRFRIVNVESGDPNRSLENYCVDTPEDLARLEARLAASHR